MTQTATSPRGRRPDITAAMAGVFATSRFAVSEVADQRALSLSTAIEECADHLEAYARRFATGTSGRRPKDMKQVTVEFFQRWGLGFDVLERCYVEADRPTDLDAAIAAVQRDGGDGERLVWALISVETLQHIPLVWHQANKLAKSFPDYTAEDLAGWGWQGLRIALRAYDPGRFAFSTYACTRISGTIRDGVRSESPIPKRLNTEIRKLSRLEEDMTRDLGRVPTLTEVAERVGMTWEHSQVLARCVPTASLEELAAATLSGEESTVLAHDAQIEDSVVAGILEAEVASALGELSEEDAEAVRLLVLEERTLQEACILTGATPRQLRARRQRGLEQLATALSDWQAHVA